MWTREEFKALVDPRVIGMVHLRPLPGSPRWGGDWAGVRAAALRDAEALAAGGVGAIMIENFHDAPFHRGAVPPVTVAAMTRIIGEVIDSRPDLPVGVNVLRNDGAAALSVAVAVGAAFIRVNVLCGAVVADQGVIQGEAAELMRLRRNLGAGGVGVMADLGVKHAAPLAPRGPSEEAADLRLRARADAIIISGAATGSPADPAALDAVREAAGDCPLLIGSGMSAGNLADFAGADGFIVGSSLQVPGPDGLPAIDPEKTAGFVAAAAATA